MSTEFRHSHLHRHRWPHPHAIGHEVQVEHEHEHRHTAHVERTYGDGAHHRMHAHTREQLDDLRRQVLRR